MMNPLSIQMIFSPQQCALERLEATLTAGRRALAERILGQIESAIEHGGSCNHLIIGARGSGKTHLLAFIRRKLLEKYFSGTQESSEKKLTIIALAEEERGLATTLDFIIACLRAMGISNDEVRARIGSKESETALSEAQDLLRETTGEKTAIVFIENLSDIFSQMTGLAHKSSPSAVIARSSRHALGKKQRADSLSQLRGFLQDNPHISLIASSTTLFQQSALPDHSFYGYFAIQPLEALSLGETEEFLAALAEADGDAPLAAAIKAPSGIARLKTILALTGGNHRLLAMLRIFLTAENFADLVKPFIEMADRELTAYYQQRLDRLSPQQYQIVQALAENETGGAMTVKEIAQFTFLPSSSISRMLCDLLQDSFVRREQHGRESYYELREPLMRIVLDMKKSGNGPLPTIVTILRNWYDDIDLLSLYKKTPAPVSIYYKAALKQFYDAEIKQLMAQLQIDYSDNKKTRESYFEALERDQEIMEQVEELIRQGDCSKALPLLDQCSPLNALACVERMICYELLGERAKALEICESTFQSFQQSRMISTVVPIVLLLFFKSEILFDSGQPEDALKAINEAITRFRTCRHEVIGLSLARILVERCKILLRIGRTDDVLRDCEEIIDRFANSDCEEVQDIISIAACRLALHLTDKGDFEAALAKADLALRATPDNIEARAIRTIVLIMIKPKEGSTYSAEIMKTINISKERRPVFSMMLIQTFCKNQMKLDQVIEMLSSDVQSLMAGIQMWIRSILPLTEENARSLQVAEETFNSALASFPQAQGLLSFFRVVRRDAMGDDKALLELPLELRNLIIEAKNSKSNAGSVNRLVASQE